LLLTEARLRALLLPMVALAADALHKFIGGLAVAGAFLIDVRVGIDLPRFSQPVITEDFKTSANSFGVR
jgi:hypothetical protein